MKKMIIAGVLALLSTTLCSPAALADSGQVIKGKYEDAENSSPLVVSVDITWGSLAFTYSKSGAQVWDPKTHEYHTPGQAGWSCEEGANEITVVNHSNTAVTTAFSYNADPAFKGITTDFRTGLDVLSLMPSAEGDQKANTGTKSFMLKGALTEKVEDKAIGSVRLEIKAGEYYLDGFLYTDLDGVEGDTIRVIDKTTFSAEPSEKNFEARKAGAAKNNGRLVTLDEVPDILRKIQLAHPTSYTLYYKDRIIACEDGYYPVETGSKKSYVIIAVYEWPL